MSFVERVKIWNHGELNKILNNELDNYKSGNRSKKVDELVEKMDLRVSDILKSVESIKYQYYHLIGEDKCYKSTLLCNLFENDELDRLYDLKKGHGNQNTGCPCLIKPTNDVNQLTIFKCSLDNSHNKARVNDVDFESVYKVGSAVGGYYLEIQLPIHSCSFKYPVFEYPGVKAASLSSNSEQEQHKRFAVEMLKCINLFPGIIIANFTSINVNISVEHPFYQILESTKKLFSERKIEIEDKTIPVILSFNGEVAISRVLSGNTNVNDILDIAFKKLPEIFYLKSQLTNPDNDIYPLKFQPEQTKNVDNYLSKYSIESKYTILKEGILSEGGITLARDYLESLFSEEVELALRKYYISPKISELEEGFQEIKDLVNEENHTGTRKKIEHEILTRLKERKYKKFREILENKPTSKDQIKDYIVTGIKKYVDTNLGAVAERICEDKIWAKIEESIGCSKGEYGYAESPDIACEVIVQVSEKLVVNLIMRGDKSIFKEREGSK